MLRKRVEELKKQVSNLLAANEVLLEQNAQFRNQAKVMTLSSTAPATEQTLVPTVGTAATFNHGTAQTHTTLSSQALQPRPVSQQELVAPAGAPAAPPTNAAPPAPPPTLKPKDHATVSCSGSNNCPGNGTPTCLHGSCGPCGYIDGPTLGRNHNEPHHHSHGDLPHHFPEHAYHCHATLQS